MLSSRPFYSLVILDHSPALWEGLTNFGCYLELVTSTWQKKEGRSIWIVRLIFVVIESTPTVQDLRHRA